VQFTNQSSGVIETISWDFGDGATSDEANPIHTYAVGGNYTVTLTVGNAGGSNTIQQVVFVIEPPTAAFMSAVGADPMTYQFFNQSTGSVGSLLWDFGDGATSTEQNPTHTYAAPGDYTVTLTATATDGVTSDSESQIISIAAPTPTETPIPPTETPVPVDAVFTFNPSASDPLTVEFVNQSTGPIASYFWDFGDGTTSGEANPVHTFTSGGDFNVSMTVTSSADGTPDTAVNVVSVVAPTPTTEPVTADFIATPVEGQPLMIQFTSSAGGPVASYFWDFGDGNSSSEVHPVHTYTSGGDYNASLTVTSAADGTTDTAVQVVSVVAPTPIPEPVTADFSTTPVEGQPLTIQFTSSAGGPVATYFWDFGDGSSSNEVHPVHTYLAPGDYNVTLTVTATDGITFNSVTKLVSVLAPLPTLEPVDAAYSAAAVEGVPLTIQFTDASTGSPASYAWDFGDGATSTEQNPMHTYAAPGDYTVILTVTAADGITTDSESQTVSVAAEPQAAPEPVLTLNAFVGEVNDAVWNPSSTRIAAANEDGTISLWDVTTGQVANTLTWHTSEVTALAWSLSGLQLASGGSDGLLLIWDMTSLQPIATQQASDSINALAWSANGTTLAVGTDDGNVALYDAAGNPTPLTTANDSVNVLTWGASDTRVLIGVDDGDIILLDMTNGQPVYTLEANDAILSVAWSPNSLQFVTGLADGRVIVWDVASGQPALPGLEEHDDPVTAVAWSPDGTQILSGDEAGVVIQWDATTGTPIQTYTGHTDAITAVEWNSSGTQFLSASDDGTVLVWQP
jgi:PKD repeat protein